MAVEDVINLIERVGGALGDLLRARIRRVVYDERFETAAVFLFNGGRQAGLVFGAWFNDLCRLNPAAAEWVLQHEAAHLARRDLERLGERDGGLWNLACDAVINDQLSAPASVGDVVPVRRRDVAERFGVVIAAQDSAVAIYDRIAPDPDSEDEDNEDNEALKVWGARVDRARAVCEDGGGVAVDQHVRAAQRSAEYAETRARCGERGRVLVVDPVKSLDLGARLRAALLREISLSAALARNEYDQDWSVPGSAPYRAGQSRLAGGLCVATDVSGSLDQWIPVVLDAVRAMSGCVEISNVLWANDAVRVCSLGYEDWCECAAAAGAGTNVRRLLEFARKNGLFDVPGVIVSDCEWGEWSSWPVRLLSAARAGGWRVLCAHEWAPRHARVMVELAARVIPVRVF